jgi:prevent-host-death family protein
METVGIRELKNRLSAYVRKVEAGDVVIVTDRGRIVAELVPPGHGAVRPGVPPGLIELARRGKARLPTRTVDPASYPLMPPVDLGGETLEQMIDWVRGDR